MKVVVDDLKTAGLYGKVKVMVGALRSSRLCTSIGADAYTSNANAAVIMAKKLIGATLIWISAIKSFHGKTFVWTGMTLFFSG